jgi:hypothetical protein
MNKVSATALETPHSWYRFSTRYLSEVPRTVGKNPKLFEFQWLAYSSSSGLYSGSGNSASAMLSLPLAYQFA